MWFNAVVAEAGDSNSNFRFGLQACALQASPTRPVTGGLTPDSSHYRTSAEASSRARQRLLWLTQQKKISRAYTKDARQPVDAIFRWAFTPNTFGPSSSTWA